MKIGIGIPVAYKDLRCLPGCMSGIANLNPRPLNMHISVNCGQTLKQVRGAMFTDLFRRCDVVLNCDVDFILFPELLKYVDPDQVVSFAFETRTRSDFPQTSLRLAGFGWTGCYSIPKHVFKQIKGSWDGTDTSVKRLVPEYKFIIDPMYLVNRPWTGDSMARLKSRMGILDKARWVLTKWRLP